ncbi:SDR family oxidoreductase [Thalassospira povalilytica]|uniref:dTDP-4-dehydrorhamnose reductase n=1 Tax=Thalassospira povalilytica TaxID=732237 RepID=A0A8I1SJR9_9PROT|nr:sugar nucleotide-binding protein [Thalassospira povalilytica]MBN8197303.1 sugar nucleotide-binding protein [Thalassospira povalilytica]
MKMVKMVLPEHNAQLAGPVIITGAAGALGYYFCSAWAQNGLAGTHLVPSARRQKYRLGGLTTKGQFLGAMEEVDLADQQATENMIERHRPSVVIHCAALSDVDLCESNRNIAFRDNVEATRSVVAALKRHTPKCHLIHISTDQVYCDGGGQRGKIGPVNLYGWTKLWSEDIAKQHNHTTILRLNYVGRGTPDRPGLVNWLINSLRAEAPVTLFQDVLFNPCHGTVVAKVTEAIIAQKIYGTFNLGAHDTPISKAEFLLRLANLLRLPTETAQLGFLNDFPLKAPRCLDMSMSVSEIELLLGIKMPSIQDTLLALVKEWQGKEGPDEQ